MVKENTIITPNNHSCSVAGIIFTGIKKSICKMRNSCLLLLLLPVLHPAVLLLPTTKDLPPPLCSYISSQTQPPSHLNSYHKLKSIRYTDISTHPDRFHCYLPIVGNPFSFLCLVSLPVPMKGLLVTMIPHITAVEEWVFDDESVQVPAYARLLYGSGSCLSVELKVSWSVVRLKIDRGS